MIAFKIFFFRQKTAYEMRISDWSSDVFSSVLAPAVAASRSEPYPCRARPRHAFRPVGRHAVRRVPVQPSRQGTDHPPPAGDVAGGGASLAALIGRASCRERVCQYVSI